MTVYQVLYLVTIFLTSLVSALYDSQFVTVNIWIAFIESVVCLSGHCSLLILAVKTIH